MALTQKSVGTAFTEIKKFNEIGGSLQNITKDSIALQLDLIQEEYLETVQAFDDCNSEEFADGIADLFVVVCGMIQKLEVVGYDMEAVLAAVCENNLSKYIPVGKAIHYDPEFTKTLNEKHQVYVLRDKKLKIRKPTNFKPVDLYGLVPKEFFESSSND